MLSIFIFSYNRGPFLKNCVDSILRYAPGCPVTVVDDDSTDPETRSILESLPAGVRVLRPGARLEERHGGLYANMQLALDTAEEGDRALFIQDDMQLVRPLTEEDHAYIESFYAAFPRAAFLNPVFLKGQRNRRDRRITRIHENFPAYYRHYPSKRNHRGLSYADVIIGDVSRLRRAGWKFTQGEVKNAEMAMQHFGLMGLMAQPFVMFLPQVPVYRGKRKSWAARMAEERLGTSPRAFAPMTAEALERLRTRDLSVLPVAEDFLDCTDPKVKKPFEYTAVNVYPLLHGIHKIEQWWHRRRRSASVADPASPAQA